MEVARAVGDGDRNGLISESADRVLGEGMFQSHGIFCLQISILNKLKCFCNGAKNEPKWARRAYLKGLW